MIPQPGRATDHTCLGKGDGKVAMNPSSDRTTHQAKQHCRRLVRLEAGCDLRWLSQ
jgi:hypothetical protein